VVGVDAGGVEFGSGGQSEELATAYAVGYHSPQWIIAGEEPTSTFSSGGNRSGHSM